MFFYSWLPGEFPVSKEYPSNSLGSTFQHLMRKGEKKNPASLSILKFPLTLKSHESLF